MSCSSAYELAQRSHEVFSAILIKFLYLLPRRSPDHALGRCGWGTCAKSSENSSSGGCTASPLCAMLSSLCNGRWGLLSPHRRDGTAAHDETVKPKSRNIGGERGLPGISGSYCWCCWRRSQHRLSCCFLRRRTLVRRSSSRSTRPPTPTTAHAKSRPLDFQMRTAPCARRSKPPTTPKSLRQ
jgi:hypothetical protein